MTIKPRILFGSICAQHDNLGDIAIRRIFFNHFLKSGSKLVLLTHGMPQSYIDAFEFDSTVTLVSNPIRFQLLLALEALRGNADLAYAPGPHILKDTPAGLTKGILMMANLILVRARGGSVQAAGRALRGNGRYALALEQFLIRICRSYVVRDSRSSSVAQRNLTFAPDLALGRDVYSGDSDRTFVSCSFRNDSNVSRRTFKKMVTEFQELGYEVVLVSQVQRDDRQHLELGEEFGLQVFAWSAKEHGEQQKIVDHVYRQSYAVVSNRLHGLIFGINCGALPIEYRFAGNDKISSTLEAGFGSYLVVENEPDHDMTTSPLLNIGIMRDCEAKFGTAASDAAASVKTILSQLTAERHPFGA
jgi:hypothetical protein